MRIGSETLFGIGDADLFQQFERPLSLRVLVHAEMRFEHFTDLESDRKTGIERGHRLLKDHRYVAADDRAPLGVADCQKVETVKQHRVGSHSRRPWQEAHHGQHGDGLSGAGLADNGEYVIAVNGQIDAVHRQKRAGPRIKGHREIANIEESHPVNSVAVLDRGHRGARRQKD